MAELDLNFMHEVAKAPRGSGVLVCIRCGRCSSSCPIARLSKSNTGYNPRRLMEMIILGSRSDVLLNKWPWYCLSCFTCLDKCPQGGDVGEVIFAVRNIALKEGNVPAEIVDQGKSLLKNGRILTPIRSMVEKREKLGLPKISTSKEEVQKIAEKTGFDKIIGWPLSISGWGS